MTENGFRRIALAQGLLPEHPLRASAVDLARTAAESARSDAVLTDATLHGDRPAISAERERPA